MERIRYTTYRYTINRPDFTLVWITNTTYFLYSNIFKYMRCIDNMSEYIRYPDVLWIKSPNLMLVTGGRLLVVRVDTNLRQALVLYLTKTIWRSKVQTTFLIKEYIITVQQLSVKGKCPSQASSSYFYLAFCQRSLTMCSLWQKGS